MTSNTTGEAMAAEKKVIDADALKKAMASMSMELKAQGVTLNKRMDSLEARMTGELLKVTQALRASSGRGLGYQLGSTAGHINAVAHPVAGVNIGADAFVGFFQGIKQGWKEQRARYLAVSEALKRTTTRGEPLFTPEEVASMPPPSVA